MTTSVSISAAPGLIVSVPAGIGPQVVVSTPAGAGVDVVTPPTSPISLSIGGALGETASMRYAAGGDLSGHRAVRLSALGVVYPDITLPQHAGTVIGVTAGAAASGRAVVVQHSGLLVEPSWAWTPDVPVYVGPAGVLTQSFALGPGQRWLQILGWAISPTSINIDISNAFIVTDV